MFQEILQLFAELGAYLESGLPASTENAYHSPLVRGVSGESQVREFHLNPVFGRYLRQLAAFGVMAQGMRSDHEEESTLA